MYLFLGIFHNVVFIIYFMMYKYFVISCSRMWSINVKITIRKSGYLNVMWDRLTLMLLVANLAKTK